MDRVSIDDAPSAEAADDVFLLLLAGGEEVNVQHFRIELGAAAPIHDHPHEQVGHVAAGELTSLVGDDHEKLVVDPGDSYSLAGGEPHGAENRGDETVVGISVFLPPRANPPWLD